MDRLLWAGVYTDLGLERMGLVVRLEKGMVISVEKAYSLECGQGLRGFNGRSRSKGRTYYKANKNKSRVEDGNSKREALF